VNRLNQSLMLFEPDGEWAGQLAADGWHGEYPSPLDEFAGIGILQPDLRKWAIHLSEMALEPGKDWRSLWEAIAGAVEQISPESWVNPSTGTLLGGRPLALARGSLRLDLKGGARLNQSWRAFENDMMQFLDTTPEERAEEPEKAYRERDRAAYDQVQVPVQLGELSRKGDGLVGVWQELEDQGEYNYSGIRTILSPNHPVSVNVTGEGIPVPMTLLFDPVAEIHWTSGILPVMATAFPPEYWEHPMRKLEWESLPIPILTPTSEMQLPLSHGPDTDWQWRVNRPGQPTQVWETQGEILRQSFLDLASQTDWVVDPENFLTPESLWEAVWDAKWLRKKDLHWEWNPENPGPLANQPQCPIPASQLEQSLRNLLEKAEKRIRSLQAGPSWNPSAEGPEQPIRLAIVEGQVRMKPRN
jgi:hypothetical protein